MTSRYDDILEGLSEFVDSVVVPLEDKNQDLFDCGRRFYGADGAYSPAVKTLLREVRERAAEAGYYTMLAPEDIGGGGGGAELLYEVWRHLYARYGPGRVLPFASVAHWSYGPSLLCSALTPTAQERMLPDYVKGVTTSCFGMSEPNAGTDAWAMTTTARADGDSWIINGTKQWITNSPEADWVFVWAVTDGELRKQRTGGISCFLVPTSGPGFAVDSVIKLFGQAGGHEGIISFTDVRVPADALVGKLDQGFALALGGVTTGRLYNCGRSVGLSKWALDQAASYAGVRRTFGHPIGDYQGVSFPLADCAIEIYAADTMARDCAARIEAGGPAHHEVAMAKVFATEMCSRVYERCMQVHGGMGLTNEMRLYDGWHQARIIRIADGSGEVLRRNIAKALISGRR
ncbi:acyl-CoA dehydrogenase [Mycobacterium sp. CVI_P3]|uniref:Medium-chain specific acyl-CoA dehydrogenase, mitochondrial n=1 Tax=Mycobacterium pinniadriaticum TaxID=2994102 RepID=A0ABT3SG58_9MYCO|nr:acyl-CoA dehydrogenase [Mycobacterium pinniadriaticum]MCX2931797.1 acyl-CoA dehydrogenase [Mycobacterium pinniadriaticum]MCX2938128.1 acyl-CoA dehydrogenase [Mycobacterium pinniadriaticum]